MNTIMQPLFFELFFCILSSPTKMFRFVTTTTTTITRRVSSSSSSSSLVDTRTSSIHISDAILRRFSSSSSSSSYNIKNNGPKSARTTDSLDDSTKRMIMKKRDYHHRGNDNQQILEKKKFFHSSPSLLDDVASKDTDGSSSGSGGVYDKISFIGTGMMAQAMIAPLVNTGLQPASKVVLYDVINSRMKRVAEQYNSENGNKMVLADSLREAIEDADLVVVCVKPQNLQDGAFFRELRKATPRKNATLLSIAAGVPVSAFLDNTPFTKIVRSMPNTPAQIGQGITVWCSTQNMTSNERDKVKQVLSCLGKEIYVDDEKTVEMSTSISGSGPAYIFMLMEAMIDGGVHMGFPRDQATKLVYQTLLGSTLYAMETGEHPAILRNSVTSPSGTTASALYELENGKFRTVIKDAMWACYQRSVEMGEANNGNGKNKPK